MASTTTDEIIAYMTEHEKSGVTVRDAQSHFNISAKSARELLEKFGKSHVYKGSGMSYVLDRSKQPKLVQEDQEKRWNFVRSQIIEWLEDGNIDIEAWATDPQKRPPHYFVRESDDT